MEFSTCDVTSVLKKSQILEFINFFFFFLVLSWYNSYCVHEASGSSGQGESCDPWAPGAQGTLFHSTLSHRGCLVGDSTLFPFANALMFPGPCSSSLLLPPGFFKGLGPLESPSACHVSLVKCLLPLVPTEILNGCTCYSVNTSAGLQLVLFS